jgi:deazaflavin-dependent oxidoreductase (nitroreductase family)
MARTYRLSPGTRAVNWVFAAMTRAGVGASGRHILTVRGRVTGRLRSTPVDVIEAAGYRWLVAGYGPSDWTHNVRAAGEVTLCRGRISRRYTVTEPGPADAVPVLRRYITQIRVTRPYFDAAPDSPDDAIKAELSRHPVDIFRHLTALVHGPKWRWAVLFSLLGDRVEWDRVPFLSVRLLAS